MRLFFLFLLFSTLTVFASNEGTSIVRNFESYDYQGGSKIYSIISTSNGLLYAGDKSGVLIYDGEIWQKIECGFPVMSLAVGSNNLVYLAGYKGIGFLKTDSANVIRYSSLNHLISGEESFKKSRLSKVYTINNDIVYVLGSEILINSPEQIRIIESPYQFIYFQKVNNQLYLYSGNDGLFKLNDNKIELISNDSSILGRVVKGFFSDGKDFFIVDNNVGVISLNNKKKHSSFAQLNSIIKNYNINAVEQINDSTSVFRTYFNGLFLVNNKAQIVKSYNYNNGLINNTVFSASEDFWGNLWVGTAKGLSSIRMDFHFTIYNNWEGIGTGYSAIEHDSSIYLGTSQGLYRKVVADDGRIIFDKLFEDPVWSLHEIEDKLYFGNATGIYVYDDEKIDRIIRVPGGWAIKKIPNSENAYLTSTPIGFLLCEMSSNKILKAKRFLNGLEKPIINFEFDSLGFIWAEFDKGVCRFKLNKDFSKVEELKYFDRVGSGNGLKKVRKIDNNIWFIADNGLYTYDKDLEFVRLSKFDRYISRESHISNMFYDKYGKLWLFADEELYLFEFKDGDFSRLFPRAFVFANKSYPLDFENIYPLDEELVLLGQEQGFLCCNLPLSKGKIYSAVVIRKVQMKSKAGRIVDVWGDEHFVKYQQFLELKNDLSFNNNSIKFYFSSGSSNSENVQYSTYMFGYDEGWSEWSSENIKEYTNLPSGDYRFIIRSINNSLEYSYASSCIFTVSPPWYLTLMAKIIYIILLIIIVFGADRLIKIRAKNVQKRLQKSQEEILYRKNQNQIQENLKKEKEIVKLKNDQLQIDNLYKSKELANSTMNIINQNQFLTDLIQELVKVKDFSEKNKLVTEDIQRLIRKVNRGIENEENWKVFEDYFDSVHENFFKKMKQKYPILTTKDLRLCAYLRMNLSTKEIAPLLNITVRGVEIGRYRLRKKLGIGRMDSLNDFLFKV